MMILDKIFKKTKKKTIKKSLKKKNTKRKKKNTKRKKKNTDINYEEIIVKSTLKSTLDLLFLSRHNSDNDVIDYNICIFGGSFGKGLKYVRQSQKDNNNIQRVDENNKKIDPNSVTIKKIQFVDENTINKIPKKDIIIELDRTNIIKIGKKPNKLNVEFLVDSLVIETKYGVYIYIKNVI